METSIRSGDSLVVGSGILSTFEANQPTTLSLIRDKEEFNITLTFSNDSASSQPAMKTESRKNEHRNSVEIKLELINFNNPFGMGFVDPMLIGNFDNGDKIFLQLQVKRLAPNSNRYEINYTFYLKAK